MRYLILGATGTLGRAMIKELLKKPDTSQILALSRDELKLSILEKDFSNSKIETVIGDIRDKSSIWPYFQGIDVCFHFAALKRIPEMEKYPLESLKTNVNGTINAAESANAHGVKHFIFSSTDKACLPINTYGACKFLSEKIVLNMNNFKKTNFSVYRWGNVCGSRGSVIHLFKEALESGNPAPITHEAMTRFWIKIEDAVSFILDTYQSKSNEPRIPAMKSASIRDLLLAVSDVLKKDATCQITGMRPGEKLHEDIRYVSQWGSAINSLDADHYSADELRELVRGVL
jgi:UDP-N-acetylglucosamine 4,6-dehydratase